MMATLIIRLKTDIYFIIIIVSFGAGGLGGGGQIYIRAI